MRTVLVLVAVGCLVGLVRRWRHRNPTGDTIAGVNVVGYVDAASGLGERARELVACLRAAGSDVSIWPAEGVDPPPPVRTTTIAVVTAVQLAAVRDRVPAPFERAERTIGYFFWELAEVPDEQQWGIGLVDEIWAPTEFVRDAYAAATNAPVRIARLPIAEPSVPVVNGDGVEDRPFTFLASFDHLSVMERKHPIGVIEAFRRAFPEADTSVRLVVKSINGEQRPAAVDRLRAAVEADSRIDLREQMLGPDDQIALLAQADAFVSLHRSEGLGLHLAEAMWLGTPVIATAYSGNLDLMDDGCAALVHHTMVPVSHGDGAYPESASWADPDLDHAAVLMRRMVDDEGWRRELIAAARQRMESQPSRAEAGAALMALLGGAA
jgi:glycosyltransferase involved in cell wall biosynthesis